MCNDVKCGSHHQCSVGTSMQPDAEEHIISSQLHFIHIRYVVVCSYLFLSGMGYERVNCCCSSDSCAFLIFA